MSFRSVEFTMTETTAVVNQEIDIGSSFYGGFVSVFNTSSNGTSAVSLQAEVGGRWVTVIDAVARDGVKTDRITPGKYRLQLAAGTANRVHRIAIRPAGSSD